MRSLFTTLALLLILSPALGQVINVESKRMQSDTVGWLGGASASVSLAQNRDRIYGADAEVHLQYKTSNDKGLWLLLGTYGFLKGGRVKYVSNRLGHLRYNRKVNEWLRWEAFLQLMDNEITNIDTRFLTGTGPRFKIIKTEYLRVYAASLVMYEREKELVIPVVKHEEIRSSSYISFTITPRDNIEIISTTYYQPLFRYRKDYRVLNQATLRVRATKHFSLSVRWDFLHDSDPAGLAPKTTYRFGSGVDFNL